MTAGRAPGNIVPHAKVRGDRVRSANSGRPGPQPAHDPVRRRKRFG